MPAGLVLVLCTWLPLVYNLYRPDAREMSIASVHWVVFRFMPLILLFGAFWVLGNLFRRQFLRVCMTNDDELRCA
jgi:hypothetical protein